MHEYNQVKVLQDVCYSPKTDDPYVKVLQVLTSDDGHMLAYTGKQWMCFTGTIWETISDIEIKRRLNIYVNHEVIETLVKFLPNEGTAGEARKKFKVSNEYLKKAHNISSVAEKAKQLMLDESITEMLDTNKNILACQSGVIELTTGTLRKATPRDYLSRAVNAEFFDINRPTPDIHAFFDSIFNGDKEVISYMQRLLGYGITGHTRAQVWTIWTGVGANGKSTLLDLLIALFGPSMFAVPPKEVFFQAGKQGQAGGHTAHLCTLQGKLFIAREERDATDQLDTALIKSMTGESEITTRAPIPKST